MQGDFTGLLQSLNPLGETEKKATKVRQMPDTLRPAAASCQPLCFNPHYVVTTLQDRSVKTSAVSCLAQCITTYLCRFAPSTANPDLLKWLKRAMSGIIAQLKKASFPSSEQQVPIESCRTIMVVPCWGNGSR